MKVYDCLIKCFTLASVITPVTVAIFFLRRETSAPMAQGLGIQCGGMSAQCVP